MKKREKINKDYLVLGSLVALTLTSGTILSSLHVSADDSVVDDVTITVPVSCSMSGNVDTAHTATLNNGIYSAASGSDYENGIGKTTLTTFCNDYNGFAIYVIGYTGNTEGTNTLVGQSTGETINTAVYTSGDTTSPWSMKLTKVTDTSTSYIPNNLTITNNFNNYHTVPTEYTQVASYHANTGSSATDTVLGSKLETTYAAYISNTQVADTYEGKVKYVLVHPYDAAAPSTAPGLCTDTATCMQTATTCDTTLTDARDGKTYTVATINGSCWMTANLALGSDVAMTLTPDDTNISSNYTLPARGTYGTSSSGQYVWGNDTQCTGSSTTACAGYYSYAAATAGTNPSSGAAASDICPKGWRLPTQDEFSTLISSYNTGAKLTQSPFLGVYAGYYNRSSFYYGGSDGFYWSSTALNSNDAYYLYFSSSFADVTSNVKYLGSSIRCVTKS